VVSAGGAAARGRHRRPTTGAGRRSRAGQLGAQPIDRGARAGELGVGGLEMAPAVCFACGNLHRPGVMVFPHDGPEVLNLCDECTGRAMRNGGRVVVRRSPN
jgi:hypothetical protein